MTGPAPRRPMHGALITTCSLARCWLRRCKVTASRSRSRRRGVLVDEPGPQFRLMAVATFVAATALLVWLAAMISRYGLGSGVWVLLLAPYLADPGGVALPVYEAMRSGALTDTGLYATLAYLLIAVAAVAAVGRTLAGAGLPLDRTLIWPLFIAAFAAGALTAAPWLVPVGPARDAAAALLHPGAPLHLAVLTVITIVISLAQWRRLLVRPAMEEASALPIHITALILAAVAVVPVLLTTRLGLPVMIHAYLLAATVAVALAAQDLPRGSQA